MAILREERIGSQRLILGDCLTIMPTLGRFDACITDPPYGIGKDGQKRTTGGNGGRKAYDFKGWDALRPAREVFDLILSISDDQVIWGGNYFADFLPPTGGWLVWDKGQRINQSDGELAYTSKGGALRIFEQNRVALMMEGAVHPTQKPLSVMRRSILQFPDAMTILDPFCGSGSTLVAAQFLGRHGTGIELDPDYFEAMCRRVDEAARQPDLLIHETRPQPTQEAMDL